MQEKAVDFLNENAFNTPQWLLNEDILDRIEASGAIERVQKLQTRAIDYLLDVDRITRMAENAQRNGNKAYTPLAMLNEVKRGVYSELYSGKAVDAYRRNLQRSFIDAASKVIEKATSEDSDKLLKSDVVALMRGEMQGLKSDLNNRKSLSGDALTRYHYEDLIARIDIAFDVD